MGEIIENSKLNEGMEGLLASISSRLERLKSLTREMEPYNLEDSASIEIALAQAEKLKKGLSDIRQDILTGELPELENAEASVNTNLRRTRDGLDYLIGVCKYLSSYLKASVIPITWADKVEAKKKKDTKASIEEAQEAFKYSLGIMEAATVPESEKFHAFHQRLIEVQERYISFYNDILKAYLAGDYETLMVSQLELLVLEEEANLEFPVKGMSALIGKIVESVGFRDTN